MTREHPDIDDVKLNAIKSTDGELCGIAAEGAKGEDDAVLEQMLSKAQRLASEMKEQSATSASGSLTGDDTQLGATGSVPATIEMKDSVTECSSVGHGMPLTDHATKKEVAKIKKQTYFSKKNLDGGGSSRVDTSARGTSEYQDEKNSFDDDAAAASFSASISSSSVSQADVDAAVQAAQEMQKQMEAALKASSRSASFSTDMPKLDDPSPVPSPLPPELRAQSLNVDDQGISINKCFQESKEENLRKKELIDSTTDHFTVTGVAGQDVVREPGKSRSATSSSSVSQDDIKAAIDAANEMQKQLDAVLRISFRNMGSKTDIADQLGKASPSPQAPASPIPTQPPDVEDQSIPTIESSSRKVEPSARTSDRAAASQTEKESCEYDVAVVDYSNPRRPPPSACQNSHGVKWEKVTSAGEGDDDFVPIRDYSKSMHTKMQENVEPIGSQLTYSEHRAAIRSRRRKRRRRMAAVLLGTVFAACLILIRRYCFPNDVQIEVAQVEPVHVVATTSDTTAPLSTDRIADDTSLRAVFTEFEPNDLLAGEITSQTAEPQPILVQGEKQICDFPFASLLSPACRSARASGDQPTESHAEAQARRKKVEQLVDSMMQ